MSERLCCTLRLRLDDAEDQNIKEKHAKEVVLKDFEGDFTAFHTFMLT